MSCAPRLIWGSTKDVWSRLHVLRSQTRFRRYRGAPGLVLGGTEGVRSSFHVLRSLTHFRRNRGRRVRFSCFAFPDTFSAVPRAPGSVFMFYARGLVLGCTEGVESRLHILRSRTRFRRYRGRRVPFSCFTFPDSFLTVPRAPVPVFMFCAP
jgi:hypothetical protein